MYQLSDNLKEFNFLYRKWDGLYHDLAIKAGMSDSAFFILYSIVELGDGCLQGYCRARFYQQADD